MDKQARPAAVAIVFAAAVYGTLVVWLRAASYRSGVGSLIVALAFIFVASFVVALTMRALDRALSVRWLLTALFVGFVLLWLYYTRDDLACWSCQDGDFPNGAYAIFGVFIIGIWTIGSIITLAVGTGVAFVLLGFVDRGRGEDGVCLRPVRGAAPGTGHHSFASVSRLPRYGVHAP